MGTLETRLDLSTIPAMPADLSPYVREFGVDEALYRELARRRSLYEDVGRALDGFPDELVGPQEAPVVNIEDPYSDGFLRMQLVEKPIFDPEAGFVEGRSCYVAKISSCRSTRDYRPRYGEVVIASRPRQRVFPSLETVKLYHRGVKKDCRIQNGPCSLPRAEHIFVEDMLCQYLGEIGLWPVPAV